MKIKKIITLVSGVVLIVVSMMLIPDRHAYLPQSSSIQTEIYSHEICVDRACKNIIFVDNKTNNDFNTKNTLALIAGIIGMICLVLAGRMTEKTPTKVR